MHVLSRQVRTFLRYRSLSTVKDATKISLREPLHIAATSPSAASSAETATFAKYKPFDTKISVLDNGLRVASEDYIGEFCTLGVAIRSGARNEALFTKGVTRFLEKLAFSSTVKHASRDDIYRILETSGALVDCQSTKDTFVYAASCHRESVGEVLELISNAIWRPLITDEELEEARMIVQYENEDMPMEVEIEPVLTDWIHRAAFRGNTLGFSKYAPQENVDKITRQDLFAYMSRYHTPERVVVAGVGVPHDELVTLSRRFFDERSTIWAMKPNILPAKVPELDKSTAQYTGGEYRNHRDLSKVGIGTPYPHLAHVVLGFEGCGYRDDDFTAFCVLQSLLGGGGSFSAGGPGKGMFTRLYVNVLNRCSWMYRATAFNHSYADTGLFCVQASSPPDHINDTLVVIADQFYRLLEGAEKQELDRAKIQLKSQLMMNLEVRPVMFEDLARQGYSRAFKIIAHGYRRKPEEYLERIDNVTSDDIVRIANRMLSSRPSLVGYGVIDSLRKFDVLEESVARRDARILIPKRMFSWS